MATYNGSIVFGGKNLKVLSISPTKTQKTIKQVIGKSLAQTRVIGLNDQQWKLEVSGHVLGTTTANLSTNRADLEGLDVASTFAYTDGIHDGTYYIVPGSLRFDDSGEDAYSKYNFSMTLLED